MADDHDQLTAQLLELFPNATHDQALDHLDANDWNLEAAVASLMADLEEDAGAGAAAPSAPSASTSQPAQAAPPAYTGPRTLDGRPAPQSASASSASSKKPAKKKGLATLSSLAGGGHDDDDDSDDDRSDENAPRDTYAGGERSGLAIQDPPDPKKLVNDIVAKAKSQADRPPPSSSSSSTPGPSTPSAFRSSGQTLGGDGVASRAIPGPASSQPAAPPRGGRIQERILHLWRDGFSIDDGPLHRFDDPANQDDLQMIKQGRAPVHLMNVRYDEELDVKLEQHNENFRQLPRVYKPFSGEGRRLGSPVPGEATASTSAPAPAPAAPVTTAATTSSTPAAASSAADTSGPTIAIRAQLLSGQRLTLRFAPTDTIGDVYSVISLSSTDLPAGWVLATTFPNKDHTDKSLVLGDMPEFKRGGTVVVKKP